MFYVISKKDEKVIEFPMEAYKRKDGTKVASGNRSFLLTGKTSKDGSQQVAPVMSANENFVLIWKDK